MSEAAETFRINATGELTNVAEYEHDPTSLSGVPIPKTRILMDFTVFYIHGMLTYLGQVGSYGTPHLTFSPKKSELISKIGVSIDFGIFVSQSYILTVIGKKYERSGKRFEVFEKIVNGNPLRFLPRSGTHLPGERDM